jgi:hypothetical protein
MVAGVQCNHMQSKKELYRGKEFKSVGTVRIGLPQKVKSES